ncbi:hypothetical protein GLYMA_12G202550v4 [Glycine max]|nr:hypothetical protein GLYMA_12G202550v4 [Glycine max]KAH1144118.1 hypothetical protein GYH30_034367 [Glycine max]
MWNVLLCTLICHVKLHVPRMCSKLTETEIS